MNGAETVQEQEFNGIDYDLYSVKAMGNKVPVFLKNGKQPYCIYQGPSRDGTVPGIRCGLADGSRWLCANCSDACVPFRGRY